MNKNLEYYLNLKYKMEITEDKTEGGYVAWYPDLPGCITCADNLSALTLNAEDAKRQWLIAAIEDNIEIKEPD